MSRRAFLRRMALAAAACAFIDVKWPAADRLLGKTWYVMEYDGSLAPYRRGSLQSVSEVLAEPLGRVTEIDREHSRITVDWQ